MRYSPVSQRRRSSSAQRLEQNGSVAVFAKNLLPERTGRLGYSLRVSPNHFDDPLTRPCNSLLKWSTVG